jgi:3-oxoadipate enol-lactonase
MAARYEAVVEAGERAPWLVMVHGMTQNRRIFSAQVEAFKASYRILLVDLPGHGLSADLPGPYGHVELAAAVGAALDEAGVGRCHYWATHTGTSLGLLLAAERPSRFRSMVLEGAVLPGHAMPSVDAAIQRIRAVARRDGMAAACERWCAAGAWFDVMRQRPDECRAEAHWAMIAEFSGAPWLDDGEAAPVRPVDDRLPCIDCPVLLYNGEHELADFLEAAAFVAARLPNATQATIAEAGGFPGWEFPQRVNRLVGAFLAGPAASRA